MSPQGELTVLVTSDAKVYAFADPEMAAQRHAELTGSGLGVDVFHSTPDQWRAFRANPQVRGRPVAIVRDEPAPPTLTSTRYAVKVWMNTEPAGMRDGYAGHHALTTAPDLFLVIDAEGDLPETAADMAYRVGNRSGADAEGRTWPSDVRSVSVGDLLQVYSATGQTIFLAVESLGFKVVPEPSNPRVEFAGQGWVTSR